MEELEMEKTNLFRFAKKELSQDAVICSILAKEDPRANAFLKAMINKYPIESDTSIDLPAVFKIVPDSLRQQDGKIDIFLEISEDNAKYAVIIEDKTDTSMHDQQMTQYISKKMTEERYAGCFFILFKTGKIPFWEIDDYKDEIHSIQTGTLEEWQFVKPKAINAIKKQLCTLSTMGKRIRFSLFSRELFIDFLTEHEWKDYQWIDEYRSYISDDTYFCSSIVFPWMEQYRGTKEQFASALTDGMWNRLSIYTPKASGKRNFDFAFEGICGSAASRFKKSSEIKQAYYFLPFISFNSERSATVQLNFHAFQNENDSQGYQPFSEYAKELKEPYKKRREEVYAELITLLSGKKWTFITNIKDNSLKLCRAKVNYHPAEILDDKLMQCSELRTMVCELLNVVFQIRKDIFKE